MENLDRVRKLMEKHGIPGRDAFDLPTSKSASRTEHGTGWKSPVLRDRKC